MTHQGGRGGLTFLPLCHPNLMPMFKPDEPIVIHVVAQAIGWTSGDTYRWLKSLGVTHRFRGKQTPAMTRALYTTLADLNEYAPAVARFLESAFNEFIASSESLPTSTEQKTQAFVTWANNERLKQHFSQGFTQ